MTRRPANHHAQRRVPLSRRRALVGRYTRLQSLSDMPTIRLHVADDVEPLRRATEASVGAVGAPIPYWAFAWAGGIAIARYIVEHPEEVANRSVLDFATGSGLCAIAAMQAGASKVTGVDIDPFAEVAVSLNARANAVRIGFIGRDLLDEEPPAADVILAGDTWYEGPFAERVAPWLMRAAARGTRVLVGDPGRRYLPAIGFVQLAAYEVHTTTQLEDRDVVTARVLTLPGRVAPNLARVPMSTDARQNQVFVRRGSLPTCFAPGLSLCLVIPPARVRFDRARVGFRGIGLRKLFVAARPSYLAGLYRGRACSLGG